MRFQSFLKEVKKQRWMVEKRKKRKADELSNPTAKPVRKKIRVQNQSQIQVPSSPTSSSSPSSPSSSLSLSSAPSSSSPSSPSSSLSISSVPPPSSSRNWTHDVFPSFRGEDVRRDFLSHIKKEFRRKGIRTFNDNGIKRGESIGPELTRGIRESKIAIVLLSRNYASSKWCLDELVEIMKCREELGQTVMAIFYRVDPSHVKKLTGDFGKVFRKTCEGKAKEEIERWRQALVKVATIAGYDSSNWDDEASMIERISTDVSNELIKSAPSSDFDGFVGMGAHMMKMERFLRLDSNEVRMIGIWGPSGIGKSTIARLLYIQYSHQFQLSVFMENIKRRCPRPCYDEYSAKLQLHKELLSQIINHEDIKIHHLGVVPDRLKDKRVLVVLDDVDHLMQLDAMAKEARWFGPGSRIIITTQDKKLLKTHGIDLIYEVDFPPDDEALEIFCMYAFGQKYPYDGFEKLAWEVTRLAGKLPLGLRVMGSHLKGMPKQEWTQALPRLRTRLDGETESVLKFSYDALCDEDQLLFLYIACFFNYNPVERVEEHLAENLFDVKEGLRVLAEKSLITIRSWGGIEMHDLLERLGREIVRKQSINEPGKRQFLVDARDICQVLRNDSVGTPSVIAINMKYHELKISDRMSFERMSNVQFLRLHHDYSFHHLPPKVRLLICGCVPSNFNPEFLVELNIIPFSKLEKLWEGIKTIRNLKWMNLNSSGNLKELPDLSTAVNLQVLTLCYCSSLERLPSSIGYAINLQTLDLRSCSRLAELPSSIGDAINLKELILSECTSLMELPSSIGNMTNLEDLSLFGCSSLVQLPSSIGNMTNLKKLNLYRCKSLVELPSSIGNMSNLLELILSGCSSLVELPSSIGNISNLKELNLSGCSKLKALPININMRSLDELDLTGFSSLKSFPEISTNISVLHLAGTAIEEIPPSIRSWSRLDRLEISYCENLGKSQHAFDLITLLHLSDTRIQEIAPWVKEMSRLRRFVIEGCTKLVSLPQLPDSLKILDAINCESLERLDCSFHNTELSSLNFVNCFKLNQEARDLIINTWTSEFAVFPAETVPKYFTYRATGSSLSMKSINGFDPYFPRDLSFKACVLLVNKGDAGRWSKTQISCRIKDKLNGVIVVSGLPAHEWYILSPILKEHLYVFEFEETVSSTELVFEFGVNEEWEIKECGLRTPET